MHVCCVINWCFDGFVCQIVTNYGLWCMCVVWSINVFYGFVFQIVMNCGLWCMCVVWSINVFYGFVFQIVKNYGLWRMCVVLSIDVFNGFVCHIVKNVDEAPFCNLCLKQKCSSNKFKQRVSQEVFEKPEWWFQLRDSLSQIVAPPNGIIFV
jgi:hypothetical protein